MEDYNADDEVVTEEEMEEARYYGALQDEDACVCDAIEQHYDEVVTEEELEEARLALNWQPVDMIQEVKDVRQEQRGAV